MPLTQHFSPKAPRGWVFLVPGAVRWRMLRAVPVLYPQRPVPPIVLGGITKIFHALPGVPWVAKHPLRTVALTTALEEWIPGPSRGSYSPEPALGSWEVLQSLGDPC